MGKQFKITLTFLYDENDKTKDLEVEVPFDKITTVEQAEQVAYAEMENLHSKGFTLESEVINEDYEVGKMYVSTINPIRGLSYKLIGIEGNFGMVRLFEEGVETEVVYEEIELSYLKKLI